MGEGKKGGWAWVLSAGIRMACSWKRDFETVAGLLPEIGLESGVAIGDEDLWKGKPW